MTVATIMDKEENKERYYKRLLLVRDKQLELLLRLERDGSDPEKISKVAKQLLSLNEAIGEFERQEGITAKL